jgi:type VI secretion system protein ImpC
VLARLPYGRDTRPIEEFGFEEIDASKPVLHDQFCWMNAAYVMGARLTDSFARFGTCTAIRGVEGGGKVEGLPTFSFLADDGEIDPKCPCEVGISDRREFELGKLGFLPLCHYKFTDFAVFFDAQTTHKPRKYDQSDATANAFISARLPYVLTSSRFAHYLMVMSRDMMGSFKDTAGVQDSLNRWINHYVNANESATPELRARFPLREARIEVREVYDQPGAHEAKVWIRPWLPMEVLTTPMRMVVRIPGFRHSKA